MDTHRTSNSESLAGVNMGLVIAESFRNDFLMAYDQAFETLFTDQNNVQLKNWALAAIYKTQPRDLIELSARNLLKEFKIEVLKTGNLTYTDLLAKYLFQKIWMSSRLNSIRERRGWVHDQMRLFTHLNRISYPDSCIQTLLEISTSFEKLIKNIIDFFASKDVINPLIELVTIPFVFTSIVPNHQSIVSGLKCYFDHLVVRPSIASIPSPVLAHLNEVSTSILSLFERLIWLPSSIYFFDTVYLIFNREYRQFALISSPEYSWVIKCILDTWVNMKSDWISFLTIETFRAIKIILPLAESVIKLMTTILHVAIDSAAVKFELYQKEKVETNWAVLFANN